MEDSVRFLLIAMVTALVGFSILKQLIAFLPSHEKSKLIDCTDCGTSISSSAFFCIKCGRPSLEVAQRAKTQGFAMMLLIYVICGLLLNEIAKWVILSRLNNGWSYQRAKQCLTISITNVLLVQKSINLRQKNLVSLSIALLVLTIFLSHLNQLLHLIRINNLTSSTNQSLLTVRTADLASLVSLLHVQNADARLRMKRQNRFLSRVS